MEFISGLVAGVLLTILILFICFSLIVGSRADDIEYTEDSESDLNEWRRIYND